MNYSYLESQLGQQFDPVEKDLAMFVQTLPALRSVHTEISDDLDSCLRLKTRPGRLQM